MRKNAEKLIKDIEVKIRNWNERSGFTIKGVKNLSMSDLDTLVLYSKTCIRTGRFEGLMEPRGSIKAVLDLYGISQ